MTGAEMFPLLTDIINTFLRKKGKEEINGYPVNLSAIQKRHSIKEQSNGLVCQYPMLTSNSISMESTQMITRALEHDYANLLLMILQNSVVQRIDGDENKSVSDLLKNYHTNYGYQGPMDISSDMQNESYVLPDSVYTKTNIILNTPYEESINMKNLNSYSYPASILEATKKELELTAKNDELEKRLEKERDSRNVNTSSIGYKKMNDLAPTLITCKVIFIDKETKAEIAKDIKFGVKGVVHPLLSEDIVYYLSDAVKDKSRFFRFIQWTTGEIKLFRDLIASADSMKKQAIDSNSKNTFWWRKLKSLAQNHVTRGLLKGVINSKKKAPIPTATMIISKEDVDIIKAKHGIDLLNVPSNAYKVMREFFLLGFVVLDDSTEMAYIFNETSRQYDYYTYNSLKNYSKDENNVNINKGLMK